MFTAYQEFMWRISADALLLVSVYLFPWWLTLFLLLSGIVIFRLYFEAVVAALLIDLLYAPMTSLSYVAYRFTLVSIVLILLANLVVRRYMRAYEN